MKTNLHKFYKTDADLEANGVWFEIADGVSFRVKRFGGQNSQMVKAAFAKHYKPVARQVELGALDPEKEQEIAIRVFAESSLTDWKGVTVDDKELPFSVDNAVKLFKELPDLYQSLLQQATSMDAFKVELGNS